MQVCPSPLPFPEPSRAARRCQTLPNPLKETNMANKQQMQDAANKLKQSLDQIAKVKDNPQQVQQAIDQAKQQADNLCQQAQQS